MRYRVPEGLVEAIRESARYVDTGNECLIKQQAEVVGNAVLEWLADNPIDPLALQVPDIGPRAQSILLRMRGVTFTHAEAEAIVRELSFVAHGWSR
jgi:hypothetical protein